MIQVLINNSDDEKVQKILKIYFKIFDEIENMKNDLVESKPSDDETTITLNRNDIKLISEYNKREMDILIKEIENQENVIKQVKENLNKIKY